ncbi:MAG TPA: sortase [Candidatus Saccharimonadales bacterium]|nr:sortase [Candidatus Saccharimonadales bacterium]
MPPYNPRNTGPVVPTRHVLRPDDNGASAQHQEAAANVVRDQLDSIYSGSTDTPTPQTTPVVAAKEPVPQQSIEATSPYERTQTNHAVVQADQWKQYHSAWQDYYQKYYERYYVGQVYRAREALEARAGQATAAMTPLATIPDRQEETVEKKASDTFSRDEAMYDLRAKLVNKIQTSAVKVRKSRHFVPIAAALCVVLLFLFLQYNRVLFANVEAYVSPGNVDPANIIVDPTTAVAVSPDSKLIIPKINVDVPVNYTATPDYDGQMKAMENGVAWFGIPGANSKPGQVGNTVLSGHSSNDLIDSGSYKFIFARLDHIDKGDTIYANYNSTRYTYVVTKKEVVKPTDVSKLVYPTDKPVLTLITCTPLGTAINRLLVTAEQVSPSPGQAIAAPENDTSNNQSVSIPGNSPTFLQRIFGGGDS